MLPVRFCLKPSTSIAAMALTSDSSLATTSVIRTFTTLDSELPETGRQQRFSLFSKPSFFEGGELLSLKPTSISVLTMWYAPPFKKLHPCPVLARIAPTPASNENKFLTERTHPQWSAISKPQHMVIESFSSPYTGPATRTDTNPPRQIEFIRDGLI